MRKKLTLLLAIVLCAFQSYAQPAAASPTPTHDEVNDNVISIYSDAYTDVAGVNTNPWWGQSTVVTTVTPGGNDALSYATFNYQGTDWAASPQNVSGNTHVHLDYWTTNATSFNFYVIKAGGTEVAKAITVTTGSWQSVDIPLTDFAGVDLTGVNQFKIDGGVGQTIYFDNFYFYGGSPATPPATVDVTFRVNAANVTTHANGLYLAGGNQFGSFNTNQMTQIGATDVWEFTKTVTQNTTDNYTFVNGGTGWGDKEDITGQSCADGPYNDRLLPAIWADTTILACFEDCSVHDASCPVPPAAPATAAPVPTHVEIADNVLSIYSDSYTDVAATNFNPGWGGATYAEEDLGSGNMAHKLTSFSYQGTQLAANVDASGQGYLHIDYWTSDLGSFNFSLIDTDPVTAVEIAYAVNPTVTGAWQSIDIPMSHFAFGGLDISSINQIKTDGGSGSETIYFDNWYFHGTYDAPTTGPTDPTHHEVNDVVISIFSGVYTDVAGTDFDPSWGQGNDATQVSIDGNTVLQYIGCDYQGTQFTAQDVSSNSGSPAAYDYYLHFDYWASSVVNAPRIAIIGGGEHSIAFPNLTKGSWQSVNIPLANFIDANTGNPSMNLANVIQFKIDDNFGYAGPYGNLWIDNLYFYKSSPVLAPVELNFFNAEAEGNTNILSWETSSELNNSHFEVERSFNGIDFEVIGTVEGNGTTVDVMNYNFVDATPSTNTYYRLRQVDFDGAFAYSEIVNINRRQTGLNDVKFYPNPVQNNLTVDYTSNTEEEVLVTVTDITGRVLIAQNRNVTEGSNQLNIDLAQLPQGNYFVKLQSNTNTTIQTIVKR